MTQFLTEEQRADLHYLHKKENQRRYADRIKSLLLLNAGWSINKICEALLLDEKSIYNYRKMYEEGGIDRLCCDDLPGRACRLNSEQLAELSSHLREQLYSTTVEIGEYIKRKYGVEYLVSGLTDLLHRIGFVYKKAKLVPGKADAEAQIEFLKKLEELKSTMKPGDKLYYGDGVHPQHNSLAAHGWIPKGEEHVIKSNTGRKRINLNGALDADTHEVVIREDLTINADSTIALFKTLEEKNPNAETIYCILDNARYNRATKVKEYLEQSRIKIVFLPPYAPNLNLIERLWKFFKKKVLANRYYDSYLKFKEACLHFFDPDNLKKFEKDLESLLTNNFQIISGISGIS